MNSTSHSSLYANLLLVAVTLLAASGWIFSKNVMHVLTPLAFLAIRFFVSGVIVSCMNPGKIVKARSNQKVKAMTCGALLGIQNSLWAFAVVTSDGLGVGAFLVSLSFVLIPVTGLLFGYRATRFTWIALIIASLGICLLALRHGFAVSESDLLFLLSAVLYAFYFNINGRLCSHIPAITQTAYQMLAAGIICSIGFMFTQSQSVPSLYEVWHWLVLSIVLATCLRFFLLLKAQSMSPEGQGALIMTLEPVWVVILSTLWLHEQLETAAIAGMGLIFLALVVNAMGSYRAGRKLASVNAANFQREKN